MEFAAFQTITIALVLGVSSYITARWLRIPAVLFYLSSGLIAGPLVFGVIDTTSLGTGLLTLVEIAVAIILFEGGLSLSSHSFRTESFAIRRILLITIPLTGIGAALLAYFSLHISLRFAIFFGALIVVTGPTVIGSLLKSIDLTNRLEILLNWESIWGDVIGVLLSAIALEMINLDIKESVGHLFLLFSLRILSGVLLGLVSGYFLARVLLPAVARLRDPALSGLVVVAGALATFFLSNLLLESSGALAVAVAGFALSHFKTVPLFEVRHFKEQLSSLFISTLFVLLAAYINPVALIERWPAMFFVAFVLGAIVRPLSVFLALARTSVSWQERVFIGLIGPRGIIAVATAAYASFITTSFGEETTLVLNLTFAIIFFSGVSATILCRPLAILLKVIVPVSGSGILLAGHNALSSAIADFASKYVPVALMERENMLCSLAWATGHKTVCADLLDSDIYEDAMEEGYGRLIAITRNDALNELITYKASVHLQPSRIFRLLSGTPDDAIIRGSALNNNIAFSETFFSTEAIAKLEQGEAHLKVLSPSEQQETHVVPLLEIVNKSKGIRIIRPGELAKNDALCYIFSPK